LIEQELNGRDYTKHSSPRNLDSSLEVVLSDKAAAILSPTENIDCPLCLGEGTRDDLPQLRNAIIDVEEVAVMKSRQGYKGYIIVARSYELQAGGFSSEFSVEEHEADGFMETEFFLPDAFPTQESAIEAGIQAGRQKIDAGFERGRAGRERLSGAARKHLR
jgi:hypothetical protein